MNFYFAADFAVFNESRANHPNCYHSHETKNLNGHTETVPGVTTKDNLETVIINWPLVSFVSVILLETLSSLREYNAVGMIKSCVAGFHLFVYSFSSIILNKPPLEICLVSWDMTAL